MVEPTIRAAGVVLIRPESAGPRVLLVHRPRRNDWSLPKGKLDPGEQSIAAAVRECDEETGVVPVLGVPLPTQTYRVVGRLKTVDYWVAGMGPDHGFTPTDEIDAIRWASAEQAKAMLTYERDMDLVAKGMTLPATKPLILLRHAAAMKRSDFKGKNDTRRPLTGKGRTQAKALVPILRAYGITRVNSSDSLRCLDTVRPYADVARITIDQEPLFTEEGFADKPKAAVERVEDLAGADSAICICTHRPVLPSLLKQFASAGGSRIAAALREPLKPGAMAVIHRTVTDGHWQVVAAERVDAA